MRSTDQLDSSIEIVTPENIAFRYEVAGPFRRMPAFLIDFAIRLGFWLLCMFALTFAPFMAGFAGMGLLLLLWFVLEWFYGGLFETYWNGQTPGKRIVGIRVLSVDGQPINGLQAVMRNILRFADMMPLLPISALVGEAVPVGIPTGMIGLITPMLNRRFQRLGDIVCGTIVVIEDRSWLFGVTKIEDPRAAQLAEYIPANFVIPGHLSRAVATYVERRRFFAPARRREISRHLAEPLVRRFGLPADTSYDLMICAVYHRAFVADQGPQADEEIMEAIGESPFNQAPPVPSFAQPVAASTVPAATIAQAGPEAGMESAAPTIEPTASPPGAATTEPQVESDN